MSIPIDGEELWATAYARAVDDVQTACLADGIRLTEEERFTMEAGAAAGVSAALWEMAQRITGTPR